MNVLNKCSLVIFILLIFISCVENEVEKEAVFDSNEDKVLTSFDTLGLILQRWNTSINDKDFSSLEELYKNEVQFYINSTTKSLLIKEKSEWLSANGSYKQEIEDISIEYIENRNKVNCFFLKKYYVNEKWDSTRANLQLELIGEKYLISKESDQISELKILNATKNSQLDEGKYSFLYSYWEDSRAVSSTQDFIPYNISITIDTNSLKMYWYSGSSRRTTEFHVENVQINDYISFRAAPIFDEEMDLGSIPKEEYQNFKFKVLSQKKIALIETDGWFGENIGSVFLLE